RHRPLKIAIASSGLGHVARGVESWARDTAIALKLAGQDVSLFQGGGVSSESWRAVVPCFQRVSRPNRWCVASTAALGGWRYGFGSPYQTEQTTFTFGLWKRIWRHYHILHVQDPWVAVLMERLWRTGLSRPRVILAHGTEESPEMLRKFSHL